MISCRISFIFTKQISFHSCHRQFIFFFQFFASFLVIIIILGFPFVFYTKQCVFFSATFNINSCLCMVDTQFEQVNERETRNGEKGFSHLCAFKIMACDMQCTYLNSMENSKALIKTPTDWNNSIKYY